MSPAPSGTPSSGQVPRLLAGVLLVAVAAFAFGRWTANRSGERAPSAPESAVVADATSHSSADGTALAGTAHRIEAALAEDAQTQATRAFNEQTELGRLAAWQAAYERVDGKNWRSIFNLTIKARKAGMISAEEQQRMWQRIGEVAGREAMDAMKPKDLVRDWELNNGRYAMQGWAQRDPAAAWSYIESLPAGNFREGMVARRR